MSEGGTLSSRSFGRRAREGPVAEYVGLHVAVNRGRLTVSPGIENRIPAAGSGYRVAASSSISLSGLPQPAVLQILSRLNELTDCSVTNILVTHTSVNS